MSVTLVDSNVLLDLVTDDATWANWAVAQLDVAAINGTLAINDAVYAELSVRFASIEALDAALNEAGITLLPTPPAAVFLAGKVFQRYRAAGGVRAGVLPDFFVGAHAAVAGLTLLTRNAQHYQSYFPAIDLVTPPTSPLEGAR